LLPKTPKPHVTWIRLKNGKILCLLGFASTYAIKTEDKG